MRCKWRINSIIILFVLIEQLVCYEDLIEYIDQDGVNPTLKANPNIVHTRCAGDPSRGLAPIEPNNAQEIEENPDIVNQHPSKWFRR